MWKFTPEKNLIFFRDLHFFICSVGLIALVFSASGMIGDHISSKLNSHIHYLEWANRYREPHKFSELFRYASLTISIFFYYILCGLLPFRESHFFLWLMKKERPIIMVYLALLIFSNFMIFFLKDKYTVLLGSFLWALMFLLPVVNFSWGGKRKPVFTLKKSILYLMLLSMLLGLGLVFYPYIFGDSYVSNDYMNVPEQTILSTGLVDNTPYINSHEIGGLFKYDPMISFKDNLKFLPKRSVLKIDSNSLVQHYDGASFSIGYFPEESMLFIRPSLLNVKDYSFLLAVLSKKDQGQLLAFFQKKRVQKDGFLSDQDREFLLKNKFEMKNQAIAGHYFHHLNANLGVINEYDLGKPIEKITFFYGFGNTLLMEKLMQWVGGINFQSYIKVFYSFYPIYYLLLLGVSALVFKDLWCVVLTMLIALICQQLIGFEKIRYAPGFNPIRHFFDLSVFLFLYAYFHSKRSRIFYLFLSIFSALLAVFLSKEFGVFVFLSLWATIFFFDFIDSDKKIRIGSILLVSLLGFFCLLLMLPKGQHTLLVYNLLGVSVPKTPVNFIVVFSIFISAIYFFLLKLCSDRSAYYPLSWLMFFYLQAISVYFIWYFEPGHLFVMGSLIALFSVLMVKQVFHVFSISEARQKKFFSLSLTLLFFFCYLPSIFMYFYRENQYNKIFKTHTVYQWDFPGAKFYSSMNPAPFSEATKLIKKYSFKNDIYIISKYDNFLPFLAKKYSALPFIEMQTSLVSQTQMNLAKEAILSKKPQFIFVDSDIHFPLVTNVYDPNSPATILLGTFDYSYGRVQVLATLQALFRSVCQDYVPVESSGLITVYERKELLNKDKTMIQRAHIV